MDSELGRCRRTDGKKWRCHQSVIPNEKYCQKHMHRGSKRSGKLVEDSSYSGSPNPITCKFPENLDKVGPTSVMIRTPGLTNTSSKCNENEKSNDQAENDLTAKERIAVMKLASGLDFSQKSVLQNGTGYSTSEPWKSISESESRCNRTDGKKWQCKKKVSPNHKYCAQHLTRKKAVTENPFLGSAARIEAQTSYASTSNPTGKPVLDLNVDINLKISLPSRLADERNFDKDTMARGGGSTISSEATESDEESTGVWGVVALSP